MTKNIQVVAFDCDGVIFDTTESNRKFYNLILSQFGKSALTDEEFTFVHAHTVDDSISYLFPDIKVQEAVHAFRKGMRYEQFFNLMKMEPFLKEVLISLRTSRKTALATNRSESTQPVLNEFDLNGYFDLVVCSLDVERPKPAPDLLIKVIEHFDVLPDQVIYIGDSKLDEIAALAAGIPFVAFKNPSLNAIRHISSLIEIEEIIR